MYVCNYTSSFRIIWGALEQPASINLIIANLFYIGGKFGANCFMAISAYFLIDSKFKVQKVISVWKHTFFYGLTLFLLNTIILRILNHSQILVT